MKSKSSIFPVVGLLFLLFFTISTTYKTDHGKYFEISKNIEIFTNLYKELNTYYVDEIDPSKLMRTGLEAMLASLDPYTNYISESDIEGYRFMTEGKYTGIGAQFKLMEEYPVITEIYKNTPAHKAGLKTGDVILNIDGNSAKSRSPEDVNNIMKGFPGTEVELNVERPGSKKELNIKLIRGEVQVPNVPYSGMISEDVGYAALSIFTRQAGANIGEAFKNLKKENPNMKGFVLDLRGNGGGLLAEAVNLCNLFVGKGEVIVNTKGKIKEWDRSFKTLNMPLDLDMPIVVLIDNKSASASEIVSGTLQDLDRGVLMGQRSYGKGLVQNTRDIGYNSKLKVTMSKYYIPSGRCIQAIRYKQGEPEDIPEDQRAVFKTRNGRKVLDGGGVKPDIVIDKDKESNILETLEKKDIIFNYVTQYCMNIEQIESVENFKFDKWNDFVNYVKSKNFDYDTDFEKILKQLKEKAAEKNNYLSNSDVTSLETKINAAKKNDLEENKKVIIDLIEKEIISRYHFQKGKVQIGLRNDMEVKEAIKLLQDPAKYKSVLTGK